MTQEIQYFVTDDRMVREIRRLDPDDLALIQALEQTGPVAFISCAEFIEKVRQGVEELAPPKLSPARPGFLNITSTSQFMGMTKAAWKRHEKFYRMVKKRMTPEQAALVRTARVGWGSTWRSVARFCWEQNWRMWRSWHPVSNQIIGMAICQRAAEIAGEDFMKPPWN